MIRLYYWIGTRRHRVKCIRQMKRVSECRKLLNYISKLLLLLSNKSLEIHWINIYDIHTSIHDLQIEHFWTFSFHFIVLLSPDIPANDRLFKIFTFSGTATAAHIMEIGNLLNFCCRLNFTLFVRFNVEWLDAFNGINWFRCQVSDISIFVLFSF